APEADDLGRRDAQQVGAVAVIGGQVAVAGAAQFERKAVVERFRRLLHLDRDRSGALTANVHDSIVEGVFARLGRLGELEGAIGVDRQFAASESDALAGRVAGGVPAQAAAAEGGDRRKRVAEVVVVEQVVSIAGGAAEGHVDWRDVLVVYRGRSHLDMERGGGNVAAGRVGEPVLEGKLSDEARWRREIEFAFIVEQQAAVRKSRQRLQPRSRGEVIDGPAQRAAAEADDPRFRVTYLIVLEQAATGAGTDVAAGFDPIGIVDGVGQFLHLDGDFRLARAGGVGQAIEEAVVAGRVRAG